MSGSIDTAAEERHEEAALAASERLKHLHLPVEIVRSPSGIPTFVIKENDR